MSKIKQLLEQKFDELTTASSSEECSLYRTYFNKIRLFFRSTYEVDKPKIKQNME